MRFKGVLVTSIIARKLKVVRANFSVFIFFNIS